MPVGFNSPARNFFLLGSSGDGVVGNFFDTIDRSAGTDGVYIPDEIRYNYTDQKYLLAGSASDSNSKSFGWFEKRDETGALDFDVRVEAAAGVSTTLRAMELDSNNNLIVAGFSGTTPWIAKYSNAGVLDWQSTTNSANVRYLGLTSDSNGNYYACGRTSYLLPDTQAFVEKFDSNGNPGWGKSAFMLGRDVVLKSIAANSRGEVVAVGFLEDDSSDKGYIVKIDTNTGEVLWDRTLSPDAGGDQLKCTDVYIDNQDQIYVSVNGTDDGYLVKYTPEGNIQWQRKTAQSSGSITYDQVFSDGETQQTVVFGTYTDSGDTSGLLTKYSRNGDLVWRRTLTSSFNNSDTFANVCLDGDPSFYYFMYIDGIIDGLNGTPDAYTFGKVSSSGNGLGAFQYTEGTGETIDYVILNEPDKIGRLSDGSVRHDTSDLVAYPFGATKIMFDDLAAKVTNKKRQMDDADSFEYSGSPAIRPADFQELNLLGDSGFVEGPNLITNGTFDNDINGWTGTGISLLHNSFTTSWDSNGYLQVNSNTNVGSYYGISQDVPTINGKVYKISVDVVQGTGAMRVQDGNLGVNPLPTQTSLGAGTHEFYFTAGTQGFSKVFLGRAANVNGANNVAVLYDNIKVCEVSVVDQSGKGNNGVVSGATPNADGYWEFDGVDDGIKIPRTHLYQTGDEISVEAWINADDISDKVYQAFFTIGGVTATDRDRSFQMRVANHSSTPGYIDALYRDSANTAWQIIGTSTPVIANNTWYHVVSTFTYGTGSSWKIYINGVEQSTTFRNGDGNADPIQPADPSIYIGLGEDGDPAFNTGSSIDEWLGKIGEVRLYHRALTAAAVFQNYNATKSKYINEAPDTAPKIISDGIVIDSNLLLNYDFGNRATYDPAQNEIRDSTKFTAFSTVNTVKTLNAAKAPDGTMTAVKIERGSTGSSTWYLDFVSSISANNAGTYTYSVWMRGPDGFTGGARIALLEQTGGNTEISVNLTDQWQQYSVTKTYDGSFSTNIRVHPVIFRNQPGATDAGKVVPEFIYMWQPQLEKASATGRHVPTYTSKGSITATKVNNLLSSSYTGTISGPVWNPAGYFEFGQSTQSAITGPFDYNDGTYQDFTVEAWVWGDNWNVNGDSYSGILNRSDGSSNIFSVYINSSGEMGSWFFTQAGAITPSTSSTDGDPALTLSTGTWNHCVWIHNDTAAMEYYLNNSAASMYSNTNARRKDNSNQTFTIGKWNQGGYELHGRIGEIRFYNRKLFASEISQNFNATRGKYGV